MLLPSSIKYVHLSWVDHFVPATPHMNEAWVESSGVSISLSSQCFLGPDVR